MVRSGIHLAESEDEKQAVYLAVGERGMVIQRLRGSEIFRELGGFSERFISEKRIELIFGACEPADECTWGLRAGSGGPMRPEPSTPGGDGHSPSSSPPVAGVRIGGDRRVDL